MEPDVNRTLDKCGLKILQVLGHLGPDKSVDRSCGETLELAKLREQFAGGRDKYAREFLFEDLSGTEFMDRVDVGRQKPNCNSFDLRFAEFASSDSYPVLIQRDHYGTVSCVNSLAYGLSMAPLH
jgi:hypothetical protein